MRIGAIIATGAQSAKSKFYEEDKGTLPSGQSQRCFGVAVGVRGVGSFWPAAGTQGELQAQLAAHPRDAVVVGARPAA